MSEFELFFSEILSNSNNKVICTCCFANITKDYKGVLVWYCSKFDFILKLKVLIRIKVNVNSVSSLYWIFSCFSNTRMQCKEFLVGHFFCLLRAQCFLRTQYTKFCHGQVQGLDKPRFKEKLWKIFRKPGELLAISL